jgi:hypothetical protein
MKLKIVALAVLAVPIAFASVLFIGESISAGLGVSVVHLPQLVPLLLLGALAWWRPLIAGWILAGVGTLIAVAYPYAAEVHLPALTVAAVEVVLVLPVLSGLLLITDARGPGRTAGRT